MRVSAVVHCPSCTGRYRIKSSHVTRNITTGPRTLDELDPLLSGDSVDLDPDTDAAPVKIDESGHVVGLSGLSELMRQSDVKKSRAGVRKRAKDAESSKAPPVAKVTRKASTKPAPAAAAAAASHETSSNATNSARERAQQRARQRKLKSNLMIAAGGGTLVVIILALIMVFSSGPDPAEETAATPNPNTSPKPVKPSPGTRDPNEPEFFTEDTPDTDPSATLNDPDRDPQTNDPTLFSPDRHYSKNPTPLYVAQDDESGAARPAEVPALLTEPEVLEHEGWYILTPPRGFADAAGDAAVQVSEFERLFVDDQGRAVLMGQLTNRGTTVAVDGEAHIALLDPAGRVFAETYLPFAMLPPGETITVRLPIAERYWERARAVRSHAIVKQEADQLALLDDVRLEPIGTGESAAVRVSVRNTRDQWLRDAVLVLSATDIDGQPIARYRVKQQDLFIASGDWLDLVVHTPLPESSSTRCQWKATLHAPVGE